mmetsp:Transcript_5517/g.16472  ORF Transcript_5517/g.16472 Transcript_5517/m.16472 type:complete len:382 (-) Transcript_5517:71-1216(-)|eukprot:CAMPEP_0198729832 /NCGR_PEP_ID=MMETSP1475-20131203/21194_1 /TAXON_ID= ORGANISM="Unidentified sp., Strain CCMP1999" /NCGR_SAMPLE_ID=MMETSP1475 /ASSEMBLY_ACC=CAM_ASM_001111 /LENGTH=381 /DNA_ID=CAMNT_0044492543 /DNA_START=80 /DNA_END=1225 /DNA_ORIENTATION=-
MSSEGDLAGPQLWRDLEKRPNLLVQVSIGLFIIYGITLFLESRDDGSFNPQQEPILLFNLPKKFFMTQRVPFPEFVAFEVRRHRRNTMRDVDDAIIPMSGKKPKKDKDKSQEKVIQSTSFRAKGGKTVQENGDQPVLSMSRQILHSSAMSRIHVVEPYHLLLCTVPGCASRVLKSFLRRALDLPDVQDFNELDEGLLTLGNFSIRDRERILSRSDYTRAIFGRPPYERYASLYFHGNNTDDESAYQTFLARLHGHKIDEDRVGKTLILSPIKTFNQFTSQITKGGSDSTRLDKMFWSATKLCLADEIEYNFKGDVNELDRDISKLRSITKMPQISYKRPEQLGITPRNTRELLKKQGLDSEVKRKLYRFAAQDFTLFSYPQ